MGRRSTARLLLLLAAPLAAGCAFEGPMTTVQPTSDLGRAIDDLFLNISGWALLIFVVVEALLIGVAVAFRDRPGRGEPRPVHGHLGLEIVWTLIPVVIVISIAIPTITTIFRTDYPRPPRDALAIEITGHQWWWEVRYPDLGVVTADEVHLPVGRPVGLTLKTADVIHSFWVPRLGGKRDLVGGKVNDLVFTVDTPGEYRGQCAEFCGTSHANMRLLVVAESSADFDAWAKRQAAPPRPPSGPAAQGQQAFLTAGCVACHTIQGIAFGVLGPDLSHVGSRKLVAGGLVPNTPEDLARWLKDPPAVKPGALMPKLPLTEAQIAALVLYLGSLQ